MRFGRIPAIFDELRLDLRLRLARRREREALIRLGEATASGSAPMDFGVSRLLTQVQQGRSRMETLRSSLTATVDNDRTDFGAVSRWMRPVVVLRGLATRAVLRHQIVRTQRSLAAPHLAIGSALSERPAEAASLPRKLAHAVADARTELKAILEERSRRLEPFGGSALPSWFPHVGRESTALGRALWLQLRPAVLPRASALVGLAVGWWVGNTYTDSHLRSVLRSLGLGHGGKRVIDGGTYRGMMFWLPILVAGLLAYLADRIQFLIQCRYTRPTPPP